MKGFTLIEIILVISITVIIAAVSIPVIVRFVGVQHLDDTRSTIVASLRQAHNQAVFQKNDSAFGVRFLSGSFVIFQGSSYASRTTSEDIVVTIPSSITVSGISEVVFTKRTGVPSTTGTIFIHLGSSSLSLSINQSGLIELL